MRILDRSVIADGSGLTEASHRVAKLAKGA